MSSEPKRKEPLPGSDDRRRPRDLPRADWDSFPPLLKVWPDVAMILRVNRTRAYELLPSLPGVIQLGKRQYRVSRDALRRWVDGSAS